MNKDYYAKLQYLADIRLNELGISNPARLFIPNVGQERALEVYEEDNGTPLGVPFVSVFGGGNGVGKTSAMIILLIGICFGVKELNDEYFGNHHVFNKMEKIRSGEFDGRPRPVKVRIVCHSESMKEDGPVYGEIKQWFPADRYEMTKGGKSYYSIIKCYDEEGNLTAEIGVKSHDQEKGAHAGTNLDVILCDEPMPETLWGETVGRVRRDGFIALFLTPLEMAAWMSKQILDDIDGKLKTLRTGSIWDNCKDIVGNRGILSRDMIENQIREWTRLNPDELEARVSGAFTHLSGAIYKAFDPAVHMIDSFEIPADWPIYQIIDPHPARPPATTWYAQGPVHTYAIAEYPTADYTQMSSTRLTIRHFCGEFDRIERAIGRKADYRYGDPNALVCSMNNTGKTVKQEYKQFGYTFALANDDLDHGHERVRDHIYFDNKRELDASNCPKFYIFSNCYNLGMSMRGYGFKKGPLSGGSLSSKIDQKYKDFADNVRYFFSKLKEFRPITGVNSFVNRIKGSRDKASNFR